MSYYSNINKDLLNIVPLDSQRILEVGCGAGGFAEAYLARNPNAHYIGIELNSEQATKCARIIDHVICGDVENPQVLLALDKIRGDTKFDVLVLGDLVEHLKDPWATLSELRLRVKDGGICVACIPNIAHWSILYQLLNGRWDYSSSGLLDKTHLRFFTIETALELFKNTGWSALDFFPRIFHSEMAENAITGFLGLTSKFSLDAEKIRRNLSTFQWVIRVSSSAIDASTLYVAGLGHKKVAGVTEARIDFPLQALGSMPSTRVKFATGSLSIPGECRDGILILHRQFLNDVSLVNKIDELVKRGWVIVSDIDDDPDHWPEFKNNDFLSFRGVHAVTVSTEALATRIRPLNAHIKVFDNAVFELPHLNLNFPKKGSRIRIFFGALNRQNDWMEVSNGILAAANHLSAGIEFVIVHDKCVFESIPKKIPKEFYPTLPVARYAQLLSTCDIALLPLRDNPFNRLKSDLKLIECCAAGVVPICSSTVYQDNPRHKEIAIFADSAKQWEDAIMDLCNSPSELIRLRISCHEYVRSTRMHAHQVRERESFYRFLLENRVYLEDERRSRLGLRSRVI